MWLWNNIAAPNTPDDSCYFVQPWWSSGRRFDMISNLAHVWCVSWHSWKITTNPENRSIAYYCHIRTLRGFPTCHSPHERVPGQYHPLPLPAVYAAQPQGNQTWLAGKSPRNVDELWWVKYQRCKQSSMLACKRVIYTIYYILYIIYNIYYILYILYTILYIIYSIYYI